MSGPGGLDGLAARIVAVHQMLDSMRITHLGGAVALAWYRNPRATTDIDLNVTLPPEDAKPVLGALTRLGVTVSQPTERWSRATVKPGSAGTGRTSISSSPPSISTKTWRSVRAKSTSARCRFQSSPLNI
jgi:hypothetical protein